MNNAILKQRASSELKYKVFLGKFSIFHMGHISVVENAIKDALRKGEEYELVFVIGSANKDRDKTKVPLSWGQRAEMILSVYPEARIIRLDDVQDWGEWEQSFHDVLEINNIINYDYIYHYKEEDKSDFTYNGKSYKDATHHDLLADNGVNCLQMPMGIDISSTAIRDDVPKNRVYLHPNVWVLIADEGWFKKSPTYR